MFYNPFSDLGVVYNPVGLLLIFFEDSTDIFF